MSSLAENLSARLDTFTASLLTPPLSQLSSQPRLGPDVVEPQPGVTAGTRLTFQALGVHDRTSADHFHAYHPLGQGARAPPMEQSGSATAPQPQAAPGAAPPPSASFVPPQPPPRYGDPPPQPSTSGWVPSGPPPTRSACDSRSSSESEASDTESDVSTSSRLADLIYEVCPDSHPLSDAARPPRCGFEAWFGQPESMSSRQHFRLYPRVAEVESEVVAPAEALARRAKPLSQVIPARSRRYAIADEPLFASSLPVNPSFAQLAGPRSVGSKRWEKEMERMERLFRSQLEKTSSSLWLMSGILAMLKRASFQPSDPTLFNAALSSASASLSQQARSSSAGASFVRSKRRESLLMHTSIPVLEAQRRSLTVAPGSTTGLFNEDILSEVVAQVQHSSLISSNLAVSRSLGRGSLVLPLPLRLWIPPPRVLLVLAGRTGSALHPLLVPEGANALGAVRGGSFFQTFRFPEVGAISLPDPLRRLSVPPLAGLEGQGRGSVGGGVVEVLRVGYRIPFLSRPPLSAVPIPVPSYNPSSTKGVALGEVTQALIAKGAVELAPLPSPGFYSRLFVVW